MALKSAIGKLWGPIPAAIKWIYEAMVKPVVLYGALVWAHKIPKNFKPFIRIQRLAMLCTGCYPRSTPTLGLEAILGFLPLDLQAQLEATKAATRITGRNPSRWDGIGNGSKRGHLFRFQRDWGSIDRIPTVYHWDGGPEIDWDSFTYGQPGPAEPNSTVCYTDGSQVVDEYGDLSDVGFGVTILHPDGTYTDAWGNIGDAIVFQGEVYAIYKAAALLLAHMDTSPVHFYVDCQAAIIAVTQVECNSLTVQKCKDLLYQLTRLRRVVFHWVKAHVGHELNEKADGLAKLGT